MTKLIRQALRLTTTAFIGLVSIEHAQATNGDSLEGVGPVSEALGGTGVAAPRDGLSALVNNPAALAFAPDGGAPEATAGVTFFQPDLKARIATPGGEMSGGSDDPLSYVPFLAWTQPLGDVWRLGFGAYGVSGMGVDYRGKGWDLDGNPANGHEGDLYTKFSSLKLAPAASWALADDLWIGAALHVNASSLDLGQGESDDVNAGVAIGVAYRIGAWRLGASYTTPQESTFQDVYNFDAFLGDGDADDLSLEQPAVHAVGIAWEPNADWLFAFDVKQLAWGDAEGYDDFDWKDQWVYAFGAQRRIDDALVLRAGFNYAENPVREHHGWNPAGATEVQGKQVPTMGYELLRNVGFPAIVESHLTLGFGYRLDENLTLNVAYAHVFEKTIQSRSAGDAVRLESSLVENAISVGLAWKLP